MADVKGYRYHPEKAELTGRLTQQTFYTSHDNVKSVQVRNPGRLRLEPLLGKVVRISGTLDSASIGHDHTDVLIDAAGIVLVGAQVRNS